MKSAVVRLFLLPAAIGFSYCVEADQTELDTVTVSGDSNPAKSIELQNSGFHVEQIDVAEFANFSKDLQQVLNTVPGINVRRNGGLGADSELSINGLSGNQIRYFIDGIPMENFGTSLQLSDFPINVVNGIDVYKGVVPISLSADALGGAINIKTPDINQDFFSSAASYGSFNTQRISFNSQKTFSENRYFVRLTGFYNHSDNDYDMDEILDTDELGNEIGVKTEKRFNDQYSSHMMNVKAGLANRSWADELSFNVIKASNRNQIQHPDININDVYGQLYSDNETLLTSLKHRLNNDDFALKSYLLFGDIDEGFNDTSSRNYNWDGSFTPGNENLGEISDKSKQTVSDRIFRANISARYFPGKNNSIGISITNTDTDRSGKDTLQPTSTLLKNTNTVTKTVYALDYSHDVFSDTVNANTFIKHYDFNSTVSSVRDKDFSTDLKTSDINLNMTGYGFAVRYQISEFLTSKLSYEKAYRLPEPDEVLGNGKFLLANPDITAEKSDNYNLGLLFTQFSGSTYLNSELNLFYRKANDFIKFFPVEVIRGKYLNIDDVDIVGGEFALKLDYDNHYHLKLNVTRQEITDQTASTGGVINTHRGDRVPNMPYLFANARSGWSHHFRNFDKFSVYLNAAFVEEYFLYWESDGDKDKKHIIPRQEIYDLDFEYEFSNPDLSVTLSINNISDAKAFDNFKIQKPGRAFYLKLRYSY
ncbi:hypothetical protein A3759_13855 [Thalassolituus sp. HI0120]|nr:hypothetical protein A3759_13855 [Thalassolituus sp. HI0120]